MNYIRGFNGLRAVSISFVFITHLGFLDHLLDPRAVVRIYMLCSGITGVRVFFVLSGFLITRILLSEKLKAGKISFRSFYAKRFIRLLPPLILFYITLVILMLFRLIDQQWMGLTFSILYIYNFVPIKYYSGELGSMWSLGVEEQFYLFWPIIITFFRKYLVSFVLAFLLLCFIINLYLPFVVIHRNTKTYPLIDTFYLARWFIPAAAPIMIGALSSFILFGREEKFKSYFGNNIGIFVISLLLFFLPAYIPLIAFKFEFGIQILQMVGMALLLMWLFFNQRSLFANILEFGPISYIGKISYGLYVYGSLFIRTGPGNIGVQRYPLNLILTLCIAILSFEFYEKPILKLKQKYS